MKMKNTILLFMALTTGVLRMSAQEGCSEEIATTWIDKKSSNRWVKVMNACKTQKHLIAQVLDPNTGK